MTHVDAKGIASACKLICQVLEEDRNRTNKDRQDLSGRCQRHSQRNARTDFLVSDDNKDGRDNACKCTIWCHCRPDIHPAESDHLKCAP